MKSIPLTKDEVNAFLHFGYLPSPKPVNVAGLLSRYDIEIKPQNSTADEKVLIEQGANILDSIFVDIAKKIENKKIVIPISGGMDSRCILAGLLRHLPKENIQTVTLGIPGTLDFEIGQLVAKKAGVHNKVINLNRINFCEKEMIEYAKRFKRPIAFVEGFLFSQIFKSFPSDAIFVSGFLGDPITGSHLSSHLSKTWDEAVVKFIKKNSYVKQDYKHEQFSLIPSEPFIHDKIIEYDEQLDFFLRQRYYIKPLVLLEGCAHIAPFLNNQWISFMLNLPRKYRNKQKIYKKILLNSFPELFSLPLKNNRGLPLTAGKASIFKNILKNRMSIFFEKKLYMSNIKSNLNINYIDFEWCYRNKKDLKLLAEKSLNDLKMRQKFYQYNIKKVWKEHISSNKNHAEIISLFVSLEIFYKAHE